MKTLSLLVLTILFSVSLTGQSTKAVIVTQRLKTVPPGKKWVLEAGKTTRIQINEGVLESGTMCNALFLSSPNMTSNINSGSILKADSYMVIFKDPEKVPYSNELTYDIVIRSIVDRSFSLSDFQEKSPDEIGIRKLEFREGQNVFVSNCLESIELQEMPMLKGDLARNETKTNELVNINAESPSFDIPVNTGRNVEPGTKPEIRDSKVVSITFSSTDVLHKQPEKRWAVDNSTTWTITLNTEKLTVRTANGYGVDLSVIKWEYNEGMPYLKFSLGKSPDQITHYFEVCWYIERKQYGAILNSIDLNEQFQFQNVILVERKLLTDN